MAATAEMLQTVPPKVEARSLVRKLAEVMGLVGRIPKSGRNEFHRYDYATEADIVEAVRKGLAERHVMMMPSITNCEWREVPGKSGPQKICTLHVEFTFIDGDSGEERSLMAIGEGQDQGDKATYKALTGATKYALMKVFLIPTGDDPEDDRQPRRGAPAQGNQQQRPADPPPPQNAPPPSQTDRVKAAVRQAVKSKAPAAPANEFHAQIRELLQQAGITETARMLKIVEGATGKKTPSTLDRDDVAHVQAALEAMRRMEEMEQELPLK